MILENRIIRLENQEQQDLRLIAADISAEDIEGVWLGAMGDAMQRTSQAAQQVETVAPCVVDAFSALPFAGIALGYLFHGRRYARLNKMRQMVTGITIETDTTHAV